MNNQLNFLVTGFGATAASGWGAFTGVTFNISAEL
jgi:hypothetical protein